VFDLFAPERLPWTVRHYIPIFIGMIVVHAAGLIDDFTSMRASVKFLLQILAGLIVTAGGFTVRELVIPFTTVSVPLGIFAVPATVLWIVALSNAINFFDGMDGLAGGVSTIAAVFLGASAVIQGQYGSAILSFALFGALIGFLVFNFPPAKIFMGDSGALFLGFILAVIPLVGPLGTITTYDILPAITLLMVPILDTVAAILRRIRYHRPIAAPDREHLHHKLLDFRFGTRKILFIVYGATALLGLSAIVWTADTASAVRLAGMLAAWIVCMAAFLVLDRLNKIRKAKEAFRTERRVSGTATRRSAVRSEFTAQTEASDITTT
jgi:UDP-GlcNAc:undecaprenyl-phosphate GlcNAc-1-phosphate transferase